MTENECEEVLKMSAVPHGMQEDLAADAGNAADTDVADGGVTGLLACSLLFGGCCGVLVVGVP